MSGKVRLKARSAGADRVLRSFATASALLPTDTLGAQRDLGRAAEVVFGAFAPFRSGRLIRGIASLVAGGKVVVRADARDPASGYDYVGVTRFGHRVARISPKGRRYAASVLSTGKKRSSGKRAALRFTIGGRAFFAASVRGYKPASDWATDALPEVEAEARVIVDRLGRKIESRF